MEVFPAALRAELWEPEFVARPRPAAELLGAPGRPGIAGLQRLDVRTYLPGDLLAEGRHRLDGALARAALAAPRPARARARHLAPGPAQALGPAGQGGAPHAPSPRSCRPRSRAAARRASASRSSAWFRERAAAARRRSPARRDRARHAASSARRRVKRLLDEHVSGRVDHGHRLWCLVMLELWQRTWVDAAQPVAPAAAVS